MPSVEQNISLWRDYDWERRGEEWSSAWGGSGPQWHWSLLPRVRAFVPAATVLEIGTGYGRWTHYLKGLCENFVGVDLSENCVRECARRFAAHPHVAFRQNDGKSLWMIPDGSVDFVFSFDSLVHAEADVLRAYIAQLSRKLKPDGVGFIHHSNLGAYRRYYSGKRMLPRGKGLLARVGLLDNDGLRGADMTAGLFEAYAREAGLQCISQEVVNWSSRRLIDSLSIFTPAGSAWARPNVLLRNPGFMAEARHVRKLSRLYHFADAPPAALLAKPVDD
ncbi:MAG TPA: class I SAM-dependent methyltransferase [Pyrinomonadaceae bacterium]